MAKRTQAGYRTAKKLTTVAGRSTASFRMLPDFLIIGAQRSGTTSLYRTLAQHPDVIPPSLTKGVHYFDTNYQRGPQWYRSHFPTRLRARVASHRRGIRPLTGEASPYYMFHPSAGARIAHDLPNVKLIAVLRDPVERAYSAHTHEKARGFEDLTFEEALAAEPDRLAGEVQRLLADPAYQSHTHQHNAYLERGHYARQLQRLTELVGRERILVVDYDELVTDFTGLFPKVLRFLDLPDWLPVEFEQRNARPRSKLEPGLREELRSYFLESDEELARWWGRTPGWRE